MIYHRDAIAFYKKINKNHKRNLLLFAGMISNNVKHKKKIIRLVKTKKL